MAITMNTTTQAQRQAGDDGAHDGAQPADHHHGEHDGQQVRAHQRIDLHDGRRQHAGHTRQRHAEAVGQRDHAGHVHAEGLDQARVFGAGAQQGVEDFRAGARDVVAGKTLLQGGDG
ncbi:hypothetical protein G6F31_020229 [Rhizopus arrhizus]|nr:hypothetical protein G6F31_020229 [Rhizopus arrhizus]